VVGNHLEELKVEYIEAGCMVLRDLHLFKQGFAQDGNWDRVELLIQVDEVAHHQVSYLHFPVEFNQDKCQCLVQSGG